MRWISVVIAGAGLLCAASAAHALATYEYDGQNFQSFVDAAVPPGSYDSSMRVTASVTLASPVAPNSGGAITPLAYSFDDGRQILTEANSVPLFEVQTDANGEWIYWELYVRGSSDSGVIYTVNSSDGQTLYVEDLGELGNVCSIAACANPEVGDMGLRSSNDAADAGTWTLVPEPGTAGLLALGLALVGWRRGSRA